MPVSSYARQLTQVSVAQGAAGATDLVVAPGAGARIYVVKIVLALDAAGTIKFTEGTGPTDLTGAIPVSANGGFVVIGTNGEPVLQTNTQNSKLSITTVTGKAQGWIAYYLDT